MLGEVLGINLMLAAIKLVECNANMPESDRLQVDFEAHKQCAGEALAYRKSADDFLDSTDMDNIDESTIEQIESMLHGAIDLLYRWAERDCMSSTDDYACPSCIAKLR